MRSRRSWRQAIQSQPEGAAVWRVSGKDLTLGDLGRVITARHHLTAIEKLRCQDSIRHPIRHDGKEDHQHDLHATSLK